MSDRPNKECPNCGTIIIKPRPNKIFCSSLCRHEFKNKLRKIKQQNDKYSTTI